MSAHVQPLSVYLKIFAALLVLTAVTTAVAYVDLGPWNGIVAMTIASTKALLVALWFMHLRDSTRLVQLLAAGGIVWFLILIVLTLSDYRTRAMITGWQ